MHLDPSRFVCIQNISFIILSSLFSFSRNEWRVSLLQLSSVYFSILFASFAYDLLLPHGCYNNLETKRQPFIYYVITFRGQSYLSTTLSFTVTSKNMTLAYFEQKKLINIKVWKILILAAFLVQNRLNVSYIISKLTNL